MLENKSRILWISPYAPYDGVGHAGGKTHNYYLKYFHSSQKFDITLLTLCMNDEAQKLDLSKYKIKNEIGFLDTNKTKKMLRRITSGFSYWNPFDRYGGICQIYERTLMKKLLKNYIKAGYNPNIIIMQWTYSLMLLDYLKAIFPTSQYIAIEEDVSYLNFFRQFKQATNRILKFIWEKKYEHLFNMEISMLKNVDLIVTNNKKDSKLLEKDGIDATKIETATPYFDNYSKVERCVEGRDILFYGAMSRPENYKSAEWFIQKVMPLLKKEKFRFIIAGGNPVETLLKLQNEHIIVTGYVDHMENYFSQCVCFVAPLLIGAGIKVKILEAMSSGIPVLTNEIGIEGINARNGKEYLYCKSPEDYANNILQSIKEKKLFEDIGINGKKFIEKNYNINYQLDILIQRILKNEEKKNAETYKRNL